MVLAADMVRAVDRERAAGWRDGGRGGSMAGGAAGGGREAGVKRDR